MYKVIKPFKERRDSGHLYMRGDTYPRAGFEPSAGRLFALAAARKSALNRTGKRYITKITSAGAPDTPMDTPVVCGVVASFVADAIPGGDANTNAVVAAAGHEGVAAPVETPEAPKPPATPRKGRPPKAKK